MTVAALMLADLPVDSPNLYSAGHATGWLATGTPDELRHLVAEGMLPTGEELMLTLEWAT